MTYQGVIIEESLTDKALLKVVRITSTHVEPATPEHRTPWLTQWTLHTVEVPEKVMEQLAQRLSHSLDCNCWYADFKNSTMHYIIFPNKVFTVDRRKPEEYQAVIKYGLTLGIPDYQLDFSSHIKQ